MTTANNQKPFTVMAKNYIADIVLESYSDGRTLNLDKSKVLK